MSDAALTLVDLRKTYGRRVALDGLAFTAPRGAITGLVGANGAGKTTCFGVVAGLLRADSGRVDVLGHGAFDPLRMRGVLGALPQDCELPGHTEVAVMLRYLARLQGMTRALAEREVERLLELVALRDRRSSRIRDLSHGMRRRVAVAQALLGAPALCLLDEPTSGLDPDLVALVRELLRAQRHERGMSLVVSSHVLGELEAICDHVVFMEAGRCVRAGSLAQVTGRAQVCWYSLVRPPTLDVLRASLGGLALRYDGDRLCVELPAGADPAATNARVLRVLLDQDAGVLELRQGESLEHAYLQSRREGWR